MSRLLEWKARITDLPAARQTANRLATEYLGVQEQTETHFHFTYGSLKLCETVGRAAELIWSSRTHGANGDLRNDQVVETPDRARIKALQQQMNIRSVVTRRREIFAYRNIQIHLDDEDDAGAFLELQIVLYARSDERSAVEQLDRLRTKFGLGGMEFLPCLHPDVLVAMSSVQVRAS